MLRFQKAAQRSLETKKLRRRGKRWSTSFWPSLVPETDSLMQELGEKPKILRKHQREPKCNRGLRVTFEFSGDDGDLLVRRVFRRLQRPDESNCYSSFDSDAHMALLLAHLTALCNTHTGYSHACMNGYIQRVIWDGCFLFPSSSEYPRFITWRKVDSGTLERNGRDRPEPPPPRSHLPLLVAHHCIFRP